MTNEFYSEASAPQIGGFSHVLLSGKRPIEKGWERYSVEKRPLPPEQRKGRNFGVVCGPASGCLVLDIDDEKRFSDVCEEKKWTLPETFTVETGSGGRHLYYRYPQDGAEYGNKSFKSQGFDIRGLGGQVVAPGSIHPDTGKSYHIVNNCPMAPGTQWLLDLCRQQPGSEKLTPTTTSTAPSGDIDNLPIKSETKNLVRNGAPKGSRSEAMMTVINALVWSNLSDGEIINIFERYPIGEKYLEKGNGRERWIQPQIDKARLHVTDRAVDRTDLMAKLDSVLQMDDVEYESQREKLSKDLGIRKSFLDDQRKKAKQEQAALGNDDVVIEDEPWLEPVDGVALMQDVVNLFNRYIVLPVGAAAAMAAWVVLTYCYDLFRVLPILGLNSPQKRCGKTTTMEVLTGLSYRSLPASNISPAAVFRSIEKFKPALFVDEADSFLKDNEELRGVLNSGHTKATAFVIRCDGENNDPKKFSTWGPKAIAAIGKLPGTIADRAVIIKLKRKSTNEKCEKIGANFDEQAPIIRRKILRWVTDNVDHLKVARSTVSIPGNDRATDNWRPLMAIAMTIGGEWPDRLASSAMAMLDIKDDADDDLSILLLADIRDAFQNLGHDRIFSANLVNHLNSLDERPWTDLKGGKGLTTNTLAMLLSPYEVTSKTMRIGTERKKGYEHHAFEDSFNRYLPTKTPSQTVMPGQGHKINRLCKNKSVTMERVSRIKKVDNPLLTLECHGVTDQNRASVVQAQCHEDEVVL